MPKKYRLLRDFETPCFAVRLGVVNTEEEWMWYFPRLKDGDCEIKTDWFEEVKERITVSVFNTGMAGSDFRFRLNKATWSVPIEKNELIKQYVEQILNDEQPKSEYDKLKTGTLTLDEYIADGIKSQEKYNQPPSGEFITKEHCEIIEKDAFYAGRTQFADKPWFTTFEQYKQSLKQ